MEASGNSSAPSTAQALTDLRERILDSTTGPGAITKVAQELDLSRSTVNRLVAPATIRKVERIERHLSEK
jgi:predicted transcriptional regulator